MYASVSMATIDTTRPPLLSKAVTPLLSRFELWHKIQVIVNKGGH